MFKKILLAGLLAIQPIFAAKWCSAIEIHEKNRHYVILGKNSISSMTKFIKISFENDARWIGWQSLKPDRHIVVGEKNSLVFAADGVPNFKFKLFVIGSKDICKSIKIEEVE